MRMKKVDCVFTFQLELQDFILILNMEKCTKQYTNFAGLRLAIQAAMA